MAALVCILVFQTGRIRAPSSVGCRWPTGCHVRQRSAVFANSATQVDASTPTAAARAARDAAVSEVLSLHAKEIAAGRAAFALDSEAAGPLVPWQFDENSFVSPFGSDGGNVEYQAGVYATRKPLLTPMECDALIAEAAAAMSEGARSTFTFTAASRLGEVHASTLPLARAFLARALRERVWPLLATCFDVVPEKLAVYDCLLVRYRAADGGVRQPVHRDGAFFTLNVALSEPDSFEGGGTWFETSRKVVRLARGHALAHASDIRHAGHRLRAGERWVLVLFILVEDRPELARRLGEFAAEARKEGHLALAANVYDEALSLAPCDHELLYGQAVVRAAMNDETGARESFARAADANPHCPRPHAALGTLALNAGETELGLTHFDRARALAADEEENAWWEAAVNGALCTALLAEAAGLGAAGAWRVRLRDDASRLRRALACTPEGDERLSQLLKRVESLMTRDEERH